MLKKTLTALAVLIVGLAPAFASSLPKAAESGVRHLTDVTAASIKAELDKQNLVILFSPAGMVIFWPPCGVKLIPWEMILEKHKEVTGKTIEL